MEEQEFTWDWKWFTQLSLQDYEEFENITGENWWDFVGAGFAVPVYRDGKALIGSDGTLILKRTPTAMMAFIYIMKKVEDSSWTYKQTQKLPGIVIVNVFKDLMPKDDDVAPKSDSEAETKTPRKSTRRNTK